MASVGGSVDGLDIDDGRLLWILGLVQNTFRGVSEEKVRNFAAAPASLQHLYDFLDGTECLSLFFWEARPGVLAVEAGSPKLSKKSHLLYLCKTERKQVDPDNWREELLWGDLEGTPFQIMAAIGRQVFSPLITNPQNQEAWPESVGKEVVDNYNQFLANMQITEGLLQGMTLLPLPSEKDMSYAKDGDAMLKKQPELVKDWIHVLESAIITWTKQIRQVLTEDPEQSLSGNATPGPMAEIEFWNAREENLSRIFDQLQGDQIRLVLKVLDQSKSTYTSPFGRLCKELFMARLEAKSNCRFLAPLQPWLEDLEKCSFGELQRKFKPTLHTILLIWKGSPYYNIPPRLVVLMRMICNTLIRRAFEHINGQKIFDYIEDGEVQRAVQELLDVIQVLGNFKSVYLEYKGKAEADCPENPWRVQNNALFHRLDAYLERCHDILDFTQTYMHFCQLGKVEIGGTKGKTLTTSVGQVYTDFQIGVDEVRSLNYDIMDLDNSVKFEDVFYEFRAHCKELERRLGSIISQGFDDCSTVTGQFKLLDTFDSLVTRPIIADELEKKYAALLHSYTKDVHLTHKIFQRQNENPVIAANLPPIAGSLTWCRGLLDRVRIPMEKLKNLGMKVLEREEARTVVKTYSTLVGSLDDFEHNKIQSWVESIETSSQAKLKNPLLRRGDYDDFLHVNFDPLLVRLLREVKYFLLLGLQVPETTMEIYRKSEVYRRHMANLDLVVHMYNDIHMNLLPVERPLLKAQLDKIDKALAVGIGTGKKASKSLNWKSNGIDNFISEVMTEVKGVNDTVGILKGNLRRVEELVEKWLAVPLFERLNKVASYEDFNKLQKQNLQKQYSQVKNGGNEMQKLLRDSNRKLKVSHGLPDWKAYVDFINDIIASGLTEVVNQTLQYLIKQLDPQFMTKNNLPPLIEIEMDLIGRPDVNPTYIPEIGTWQSSNKRGFVAIDPRDYCPTVRDLVMGWVDGFLGVAQTFKRLDSGEGSYIVEVLSDPLVQINFRRIQNQLDILEKNAQDYRDYFHKHAYLWRTDLNRMFSEFLATSLTERPVADLQDDATTGGASAETPVKELGKPELMEESSRQDTGDVELETEVDLTMFENEIRKYLDLQDEVAAIKHSHDLDFIRINAQPIKQAIAAFVTKWAFLFTKYLQDHMTTKLQEIHDFIQRVDEGLNTEVTPGNITALMAVMTQIRDVRKSIKRMDDTLPPLGDIVMLLKKNQVAIEFAEVGEHQMLDYLEAVPLIWENTVNRAFRVKEEIQPLQNAMADSIKKDISAFKTTVTQFSRSFRAECPFAIATSKYSEAYRAIDRHHKELSHLEAEAKKFKNLEELFELPHTRHSTLSELRQELVMLKRVWDMVVIVQSLVGSWKSTLWAEIDTDSLLEETTTLGQQVKKLPRRVRDWSIYQDLESSVKNMSTVLPLIHELHSPALRDRHWNAVVAATHTHFESGQGYGNAGFDFEDVLSMNLHMYVEGVTEVVELANKELKVETKLKLIEDCWRDLALEFITHKDTEVQIITSPDEILETLEEQQLTLQSMAGMGKFVEFFRDRVTTWQTKLGNVEGVLKLLVLVQRQWTSLEAIFLASADMRAQLPDDTKRFEAVDAEFKDLMKDLKVNPLVIDSCQGESREVTLRHMYEELEKCEKALNEYLDVKKNLFPRFYFVSNAALLDILSNGNSVVRVMPHLSSVFEGIDQLMLLQDEKDPTVLLNSAIAMISRDKEEVQFFGPFKVQGQVECWLNDLVIFMQNTLKSILDVALTEAAVWESEKPREEWLYGYPAQLSLLASQIVWTEEVEAALEELEQGTDDAMKKYLSACTERLEDLIRLVQGPVNRNDRAKIITLITIDVHNRDVVQQLIDKKVESNVDFAWQQQLRYTWQQDKKLVNIRICDFRSVYSNEYIGNCGRLVITPLTDRCYVTLTTALRLMLGGAPAGPAGTGKTETTKDLAKNMGLPCYVFNCSDQMNYQTMGDIFKGLAQVGAWGCFDEFNRIQIEVLSVVASQVKTILEAVVRYSNPDNRDDEFSSLPAGTPPEKVGYIDFFGVTIGLVPTCGLFITMNPGYAGRTELPENLKALFRSCAMIRPDLKPICENMLMAEGFVKARPLAVKFVTLYSLSLELLSKQAHYDWGLRAVKSLLRVAGNLKRAEPEVDEEAILMRALRDFNTPKIPTKDTPIFLRLISDLFPGMELETVVNESLKEACMSVCAELGQQQDEIFVGKVVQFQELLDVRHSVMLLGPAGCGKTTIWKTLVGCQNLHMEKPTCVYETVNPKSVTSDELYGYMTLSKDWRDGVLSIIMRKMSKNWPPYFPTQESKWVVLDGDIDAVWIESMNTVMDDNKVLTLVSNERIPLSDSMRMVFEIHSLRNATPATVSRAGILYINPTDIGYMPLCESWVATRTNDMEKGCLPGFFSKHVPVALEILRISKMETLVPIPKVSLVSSVCSLLEGMLQEIPDSCRSIEHLERIFLYALMWGVGGALSSEKNANHRKKFSTAWADTFKQVKFPANGLIFDYAVSFDKENEIIPWAEKVPAYVPVGLLQFHNMVVPTVDNVRLTHLTDLLVEKGHPVMLVGSQGTGKTTLIREYLKTQEMFKTSTLNMNFYTDSGAFQQQLEQAIDKRSGKTYGPPSGKKLIYFVDDLNMPYVEEYGTQTPIALLRQYMDYKSWFDRSDPSLKKIIQDIFFLCAMNHKSGSFSVNPRLQRHFVTFGCQLPSEEDLKMIYGQILNYHLTQFPVAVQKISDLIVEATVLMLSNVMTKFLPSAVKFHYNFNMRDISAIFQGVLNCTEQHYDTPAKLCKLWMHECTRVFCDRLITQLEITRCQDILYDVAKRYIDEETSELTNDATVAEEDHAAHENDEEAVKGEDNQMQKTAKAKPINVFTWFVTQTFDDEPAYLPVTDIDVLKEVLEEKLQEHNETNPIMDLVLFNEAILHITRIARIISFPRGNALLIGVGGSGKQSLSKLSSYICGYKVVQLQVTTGFGVNELKAELKTLYQKAAVKPAQPVTFLLTDSQILKERFLVYVNDILSTGVIPDLFAADEYDSMFSSIRNVAKAAGVPDSRDHMMEFFIERVRSNLHVVLCMSPVGETLRNRARKFPGLINCTAIDWFHEWPKDALISVAQRFLEKIDLGPQEIKESVAYHMAEIHSSVNEASIRYLEEEKRHNYTTPKSFLELISFYEKLLGWKRGEMDRVIGRLEMGLGVLQKTNKNVEALHADLKIKLVEVEEKKVAMDVLLEEMGKQRNEAQAQQDIANKEQEKADKAADEATRIEQEAAADLALAKPALDAAKDAVNCLDKPSMTELKSFACPPGGVEKVTAALLIMIRGEKRNFNWDNAKKMMAKIDAFKEQLEKYRGEDIPEDILKRVEPLLADPSFSYNAMFTKSRAAANLCNWVVNTVIFHKTYKKVKPLMDKLDEAKRSKARAEEDVAAVQKILKELETKINQLQARFLEATNEKNAVEAEAKSCEDRLLLAERLTKGLEAENIRWTNEVESLQAHAATTVGDVLISSAFVSYIGSFGSEFRENLWKYTWLPDIVSREIPISDGIDPLNILTNDSKIAEWNNLGLPADRISIENGAIMSRSERWPLLIDPQLQGITFLRKMEEERCQKNGGEFHVLQQGEKGWMRKIVSAIQSGHSVLIENLGNEIDAVLDPVLTRAIYRKGRGSYFLMIGGEDVEYDPSFRLYLQTKLANPHYRPELFAQCTLINFIVTEKGLEEQLLAKLVSVEQPQLEKEREELVQAFNSYKIQLIYLEDQLLERLVNAPEDILSDVPLIEGLEATKEKATEINISVERGKETEQGINEAREVYRKVAAEASALYFMLLNLAMIDHMYQFSLESFSRFFLKATTKAASSQDQPTRVHNLQLNVRITIFTWVVRGLFEKHRLAFLSQLTFGLMKAGTIGEESGFSFEGLEFLLRTPKRLDEEPPVEWIPETNWGMICALSAIDGFEKIIEDLTESGPRFKEWYDSLTPETEKLPLHYRELDKAPFRKLLFLRCLRADRLQQGLREVIVSSLPDGLKYADCDEELNRFQVLEQVYLDSTPSTPIYFILSPGANIVADVDALAQKIGMKKGVTYHNISLGQGQDVIAMQHMEYGYKRGHWIFLNNLHLMPRWLAQLENTLREYEQEGLHDSFRLLLSSDPSNQIPIGLLERSIKLTNDPPSGIKANLKGGFQSFSKEFYEELEPRTRGIMFSLCYFHAIMLERKKFGSKGFNMMYPFSTGDLICSVSVLKNYMETAPIKVPWQDLRYLFGDIMYGGHIVDDFDRLMVTKYLEYLMQDQLLDEINLYPYSEPGEKDRFLCPNITLSYDKVMEHIETELKGTSPLAFGLHPNAAIGFSTDLGEDLLHTVLELMPQSTQHGEGRGLMHNAAEATSQDILEILADVLIDLEGIESNVEVMGPYQNVLMQEAERMNKLIFEIVRSLNELNLGFKGDLTMTQSMEELEASLSNDKVPASWARLAYPSLRSLAPWLADLQRRLSQLQEWSGNPSELPLVMWLTGLFNPQSFLTAIMQVTAQAQNLELDKLSIVTEVTKKMEIADITAPLREGAYINGLNLEGARWDVQNTCLETSKPREMFCPMPIIIAKAAIVLRVETNIFSCPVYKTQQRGPTYVFNANLKTKAIPSKWVLAGVVLIMDII